MARPYLPYEVRVNITRERAHDLIIRLADEPDFREQFETNPYAMLSEHGIDVSPGALPEQVRLPDPDAIREFLHVTETRILPETASPFAHAVMLVTMGAMPLLAGERPVLDGTG
jgi:hypothetical protein